MSVSALPTHARERLELLRSYRAGGAAENPAGKLSSNESPLGPAPQVRLAIAAAAHEVNRYPDARGLETAVGIAEGVPSEQVILTNGSDELCYLIAALFMGPGSVVVLSDPCYQIDELVTRLHRGEPRLIPIRPDGGHDLMGLARAASDAAIVWLPTPHNPTGVAVEPDELIRFLDAVPESCLVVLDEAYRTYVAPELRPSTVELVTRYPNLLAQRTFSKSYALAGMRVGYGFGNPEVIEALKQIKPPFNVGSVSLAAAQAALESIAWRDYTVDLVRRERERFERTLVMLGVEHFPSQANFVTVRFDDLDRVQTALVAAGLSVRDGADLGMPGWVRISMGAPAVMAQLRAILEEIV